MIDLFILFRDNLLPILLIAGAGFALGKVFKITPRALSQVIFYIFSPALVFHLLTDNDLNNKDIVITILFATVLLVILAGLTWLGGKLLKLDRKMMAAVLLTALFMNAGNYGLPVIDIAFGGTALAFASLFFVTTATYTNSVGVVIASSGHTSVLKAIKGLLRLPSIYALFLGIIIVRLGVDRLVVSVDGVKPETYEEVRGADLGKVLENLHRLNEIKQEVDVPNVVTAVLASYRGYDTLGETTVVFTAGAGVVALLRRRRKGRKP